MDLNITQSWQMVSDSDLDCSLGSYLSLIYGESYYEAHEALEELWFPNRFNKEDELVTILKYLINGAVALRLRQLGKIPQSEKVWGTFLKIESFNIKNEKILECISALKSVW